MITGLTLTKYPVFLQHSPPIQKNFISNDDKSGGDHDHDHGVDGDGDDHDNGECAQQAQDQRTREPPFARDQSSDIF